LTIHGFIPINKSAGLTSQQVVTRVKKIIKCKKAGHTGTLDPAAEGLLLVAVGKATRLTEYFLSGDKGYRASICFGTATDTGDREGNVVESAEEFVIAPEIISDALTAFQGEISQVPPAASALKINGTRAYTLFRQGLNPEMPARIVTIHSISSSGPLVEINPSRSTLTIDVVCSKGTYIRSLAADIGVFLGCPAHLSALVRTSISQITLNQAATLADLELGYQPWLMDMSIAVEKMPRIDLEPTQSVLFSHGRNFEIDSPDGEIAVFSENKLQGIARATAGIIKPVKVLTQEQ